MIDVRDMSQPELAAFVEDHLRKKGIDVVLSGGAAVALYTGDKYVSKDIDLIDVKVTREAILKSAMEEIGFRLAGRSFEYPGTQLFVEFPPGPLAAGDELIKDVIEKKFRTGILKVISPTECIKDRLSWYYHMRDLQCLTQAVLVAQNNQNDVTEIARWSKAEGKESEFQAIKDRLVRKSRSRK